MIIVQIKGGLGNQMFQYALGRKMSLKNKDVFKLDISGYTPEYSKIRPFQLPNFNIIENIATPEEIRKNKLPHGQVSRLIRGFKARILRIQNVRFKPYILRKKSDMYLNGYWQSEKYFADIADTIRQDFRLHHKMSHAGEIVLAKIASSATNAAKENFIPISLHIRRGDYAQDKKTNDYHGTCSPEYYKKALAIISEKIGQTMNKKIQLFVFSDDIDWVKKNLTFPYPTTFVSNPAIPNYEELILMSHCSHHIIANSSFSWWGAWLNPSRQKVVIAPEKWFNTRPSVYKDIVPDSWIKI